MIACASTVSSPADDGISLFIGLTRCATGIDDLLSKHIAHLFIRDPIVIFSELVDQDDSESTDHFEVCFTLHCHSRLLEHGLKLALAEHTINQLADFEIQAPSSEVAHRLACRVPQYGGSDD
jgi:Glutamate-cysteine ligase